MPVKSTQTTAAQKIAQANAYFMRNSIRRGYHMNAPNGTTFAPGSRLVFNAPIIAGWAYAIRVSYSLTIAYTPATGDAQYTSWCFPWNCFTSTLQLGATLHDNVNAYVYRVLQQLRRGAGQQPVNYGFQAVTTLGTTIYTPPQAVHLASGNTTFTGWFDIPLQLDYMFPTGCLPLGSSATPLSLILTCNPNANTIGFDPLLNPVVQTAAPTSGTPTIAITGTVTAKVRYLWGQSPYSPMITPGAPTIQKVYRLMEQTTPVTVTNADIPVYLQEPYKHIRVIQALVQPNTGTNVGNPYLAPASDITSWHFDLAPGNRWLDYSGEAEALDVSDLWADQRSLYGTDLDAGVVVADMEAGDNPRIANGLSQFDVQQYNSAQVVFRVAHQYNNSRIMTWPQFLFDVGF